MSLKKKLLQKLIKNDWQWKFKCHWDLLKFVTIMENISKAYWKILNFKQIFISTLDKKTSISKWTRTELELN